MGCRIDALRGLRRVGELALPQVIRVRDHASRQFERGADSLAQGEAPVEIARHLCRRARPRPHDDQRRGHAQRHRRHRDDGDLFRQQPGPHPRDECHHDAHDQPQDQPARNPHQALDSAQPPVPAPDLARQVGCGLLQ